MNHYECCKGCTKRRIEPVNCHSSEECPEWAEAAKKHKAEKENIRKIKEAEDVLTSIQLESKTRNRKRKHLIGT